MANEINVKVEAEKVEDVGVDNHDFLVAYAQLQLKDGEGNILEEREFKCESFVRQFLDMLYNAFSSVFWGGQQVRSTSNVLRNLWRDGTCWGSNAGAGDVNYGIQIGTGAVAPTISDYALGAQILHGVAAGQMQYSDMATGFPSEDGVNSQITVTRNFANNSGGAITVNEISFVLRHTCQDTVRETGYFMVIRDTIAGGIAVPDGITLTINYRLQAAV